MTPLYKKVKSHILDKIYSGELPPSSRVPSEHELVKTLSVSRMTANRAMKELAAQGVLTRVAGVGTFVSEPTTKGHLLEVLNIAEEVQDRGNSYSNKILKHEQSKANQSLSERMDIPKDTEVYHSLIVHFEDEKPIQLEDRYVNLNVLPEYKKIDLTITTPSRFLLDAAPLQKVHHTVRAAMPSRREKKHLHMDGTTPCLILERKTWSRNKPITFATFYHPADHYTLSDTIEI